METVLVPGSFTRPFDGPRWLGECKLPVSGKPGWQSNGGSGRLHPARGLPFTCEVAFPADISPVTQISLVGVFALYSSQLSSNEVGAVIQLTSGDEVLWSLDIESGVHYTEATDVACPSKVNRDGTELRRVGISEMDSERVRVDMLKITLPSAINADRLVFRDLGGTSSFILYDVFVATESRAVCPFRGQSGQISLAEIGGILRLRDSVRFSRAVSQLEGGILAGAGDLDEARGNALTFLAVVSAALLELGADKKLHRFQLESARRLEKAGTFEQIAICAQELTQHLVEDVFGERKSANDILVDRSLNLIERHYAKVMTDAQVADKLGVSTSHFRHLFRQRTGQPFHKYLLAFRLERSRESILSTELPVNEIAEQTGFVSSAHFSRAFSQRFGVPPSSLRNSRAV